MHLGELKVVFQLHVKSPLSKGAAGEGGKAKSETRTPDTAAEFIVGPGATGRVQTPRSKYTESRDTRSKLTADSPPQPQVSRAGGGGATAGGRKHEKLVPVVGEQQMKVISELLDRGHVLRDKMLQSLRVGSVLDQQEQRYGVSTTYSLPYPLSL